ncbi:hypothetical protein EDB84DRAFT_537386 [Lactarius hengduanensis]|nr:hypothetical protein EDB84DRAFT_537386 [Lactarius hengduanensis]
MPTLPALLLPVTRRPVPSLCQWHRRPTGSSWPDVLQHLARVAGCPGCRNGDPEKKKSTHGRRSARLLSRKAKSPCICIVQIADFRLASATGIKGHALQCNLGELYFVCLIPSPSDRLRLDTCVAGKEKGRRSVAIIGTIYILLIAGVEGTTDRQNPPRRTMGRHTLLTDVDIT